MEMTCSASHLLAILGVEQQPPKLYDLGRVLCHVHTMFVTGGRHVNDDISIDFGFLPLIVGHADDKEECCRNTALPTAPDSFVIGLRWQEGNRRDRLRPGRVNDEWIRTPENTTFFGRALSLLDQEDIVVLYAETDGRLKERLG